MQPCCPLLVSGPWASGPETQTHSMGGCLPGACPARYLCSVSLSECLHYQWPNRRQLTWYSGKGR